MSNRERQAERGQAAVELVALLPAIVLLALVGWQIALTAHEWTLAGSAARAAVRAQEVGAPAAGAADAALGQHRAGRVTVSATVSRGGAPRARVELSTPGPWRWMPRLPVRGREAHGAYGSGQ